MPFFHLPVLHMSSDKHNPKNSQDVKRYDKPSLAAPEPWKSFELTHVQRNLQFCVMKTAASAPGFANLWTQEIQSAVERSAVSQCHVDQAL